MSGFSNVVVVGDWAPYRGRAGITEVGGMSLCFCPPRLRDLEAELRRWEPCWLLVGGVEEGVVERLLGRLIPAHPRVRVAMLGEGWDRQRCERWPRWGGDAYLSAAASAGRVLGCSGPPSTAGRCWWTRTWRWSGPGRGGSRPA